jgi:hypothetical protein
MSYELKVMSKGVEHTTVLRRKLRFAFFLILNSTFIIHNSSLAQINAAARYEIDAKRNGLNPTDKDALPRSREFIRLDSTYYVGYMFEGQYKADKSSDYLGYRNAVPALRKAFDLIEKDYGNNLKKVFSSQQEYMLQVTRYGDFLQIANTLKECYDNIEMADSVMWVLNKVEAYNYPKDHMFTTTAKAWTYHRNRFYTSDKFSFLKNSVEENEKMALQLCYNALGKIDQYQPFNDAWYGAGQADGDKLNTYHYLALIHCYNKNYDSSELYYRKMMDAGGISWNNYGGMQHELGSFALATEYFSKDRFSFGNKGLKEPYYFLPMLNVYAGRTKEAMNIAKEAIEFSGSTPGFGWYNIALARSYLYDGQLDSAEYSLNKAAAFKEIHIGTTLTQTQYEFSINLLRLQLIERKIGLQKFNNRGWWYSPTSLYNIASLNIEKMLLQYVLINQLTANPERNRVVYDLFCAESTTSFDEALYLLKDFSPAYFIKKYDGYVQADSRTNLKRYFRLIKHEMEWQDGDEDEATEGFENIIKEVTVDTANEKLFLGRLYEGLAKVYDEDNKTRDFEFYSNVLFEEYPQLIPFSNLPIKMRLVTAGIDDDVTQKIIKELKKCNIEWADNSDANTPVAKISFNKKGEKYEVAINVNSGSNKAVVRNEKFIFKPTEGVGKEVALRLFSKGGAMVWEKKS